MSLFTSFLSCFVPKSSSRISSINGSIPKGLSLEKPKSKSESLRAPIIVSYFPVPDPNWNRDSRSKKILNMYFVHDSDPNCTYIFGLVSDLFFQIRQTVESYEKTLRRHSPYDHTPYG
ncbi:hypothetical protein YC2023_042693 [Brassica napus]